MCLGQAGEGGEEEYYEEGEALEGEEGETQSEGFTWNAEMREEFEQLKEDRH